MLPQACRTDELIIENIDIIKLPRSMLEYEHECMEISYARIMQQRLTWRHALCSYSFFYGNLE